MKQIIEEIERLAEDGIPAKYSCEEGSRLGYEAFALNNLPAIIADWKRMEAQVEAMRAELKRMDKETDRSPDWYQAITEIECTLNEQEAGK